MKKITLCLLAVVFVTAVKAQVTPKGAQYQIFTKGTGPKIKLDDIVTFNVIEKTDKDSLLISTYKTGQPVQVKVQPSQNVADLMEVFPLLGLQDSAVVHVPTDSIFKGHEESRPAFLPLHSNLNFTLKIEKIQSLNEAIAERNAALTKLQQAEATNTDQYIAANKLVLKTTPSGLKYQILSLPEKGSGRKPLPGDTVMVNYVGRTLTGKVFDASVEFVAKEAGLQQPGRNYEPIRVVIGAGQVIPGWDEGLQLLPEGAAAKLVIPSKLAYGSQGAGQDIAPFSTLVFDINLLRIYPTKHAAVAKTATTAKKTTTAKSTTAKKKVTHK